MQHRVLIFHFFSLAPWYLLVFGQLLLKRPYNWKCRDKSIKNKYPKVLKLFGNTINIYVIGTYQSTLRINLSGFSTNGM